MCRFILFEENLITHDNGEVFRINKKCSSYFIEEPSWIHISEPNEMKLICPKENVK